MKTELHWAGLANARLNGRDIVPGFVRVRFTLVDDEPVTVQGAFVPGGAAAMVTAGAAVELLLPRGVIGRATLGERQRGLFRWQGELPWPGWRELFRLPAPANGRPEPVKRPGFLELRAASPLTAENWVNLEDLTLSPGDLVLLDYRPVTEITAPLDAFLTAAKQIEQLGLKVAMVGSGLLVLGITREAAQVAIVGRSENVRIFEDYDEARFWLLS